MLVLYFAYKVARSVLGRKAGGHAGFHLQLVETLYLGPNRAVHLVKVGKQLFLVGAAERNLTFLAEIQDPDLLETLQAELAQPVAGRQGSGKGFGDYLKGLLDGGQNHSEKSWRARGADAGAENRGEANEIPNPPRAQERWISGAF